MMEKLRAAYQRMNQRERIMTLAVAGILFALVNIFFTRMVFSWIDRWLSTRRAREIFTGMIFVVSFGIQYINFTFNPFHRS